jgi:hypothetical protein
MSCGYQGYEFGAAYPDSLCCDGLLWDADSCDEPGGGLSVGGDIPCPRCNTAAFLSSALSEAKDGGCGLAMFTPHCAMVGWEGAIAKARRESPVDAETFLRGVEPFTTDDWPDRQAVYKCPFLWRETVEREWRYSPPAPSPMEPM